MRLRCRLSGETSRAVPRSSDACGVRPIAATYRGAYTCGWGTFNNREEREPASTKRNMERCANKTCQQSIPMYLHSAAKRFCCNLQLMRFSDPLGNCAYAPEINQPKALDGSHLPFWPPRVFTNCIEWPPPQNIQNTQLEEVADRFKTFTRKP